MSSTSYQSTRPVIADSELPAQTQATNGMALISNGATSSWNYITATIGTNQGQVPPAVVANAVLPSQTGNAGSVLTTDGTNVSWQPSSGGPSAPAGVFFVTADEMFIHTDDYPNGSTIVLDPVTTGQNPRVVLTDAGNASYPAGTVLHFVQNSLDNVTFASQASAAIMGKNQADRTLSAVYSHASLKKLDNTMWILYGDVTSPPM